MPAVEVLQVTGGTTNGGLNLVQQVNLDLSVFSIDLTQAGIMGMAVVDL